MDENFSSQLAQWVLHGGSAEEISRRYFEARPLLPGWRFVIEAERGLSPHAMTDRQVSGPYVLRGVFRSGSVLFLDGDVAADLRAGSGSRIAMDGSASMDTQVVSALGWRYHGTKQVPDGFDRLLAFVAEPDSNVDPVPYIHENFAAICGREGSDGRRDEIVRTLVAYEALRRVDHPRLLATGKFVSVLSDAELRDRAISFLSRVAADPGKGRWAALGDAIHCALIKMALIQLGNPQRTAGWKVSRFVEFLHEDLALMLPRPINVACAYFSRNQQFPFFSKVMSGRRGMLGDLRRMAWDVLHVQVADRNLSQKCRNGAKYFIPGILTADRGMTAMIDLCGIRAAAFPPQGPPETAFAVEVPGGADPAGGMGWLAGGEAAADRARRLPEVEPQLPAIRESLEGELARIAGLEPQGDGDAAPPT